MFPACASNNSPNRRGVNSIVSAQFRIALALTGALPDLLNRRSGQPRPAASALNRLINGIVFVCAKKQMIGIDAGRVVAPMEYQEAYRNRPIMDFPRCTVRSKVNCFTPIVNRDNPIRYIFSYPCPRPLPAGSLRPTTRSLVNSFPEANYEWYFRLSHNLNLLKQRFNLWSGSLTVSSSVRAVCILT